MQLFTSLTNSCLDFSHPFIILLLFFTILPFLQWWKHHRDKDKRLPPGSMGWPYFGETLKLYTQNPNSFFSTRQKRYGDIFKTHILGCPCVMISSPEAARAVLVTQAHLFKPTYPPSKEKLIGPEALFFQQGAYHSMLKKLVQASFLPSTLKNSVSHVDQIVQKLVPTWANRTINTLQEMKKYAFEVAANSAFGEINEMEMEEIRELYHCLEKGYNSYPLNLHGTSYWKALKARKVLNESIRRIIERRKESRNYGGGLLGILLRGRGDEKMNQLTDSQVADNIIGVIFAAHDTTASVLTWVLKYLHDNVNLLETVTKEQEEIRSKVSRESRGLSWEDTRQMPFTSRVIQETLRSASILSFTFREAVRDVKLQGYSIPKGWKVLPLFRTIHHSPHFFPQPHMFDPSRFENPPRPNTYMPFGNGVHSCPGSELAKLEVLVLLHHLTLSYRWQVVGNGDGIQYGPFPVPKHGLPVKITLKNS
ncbi:putative (+)-abscisic acid 8'-hydroxylase [Medicago truncatula]|uniref:(+)-abscisic acid 8'-hydroxylase n=1 Tax=Medicago truncatula TaxID=3880 RepID=A0A072VFZ6_MEDTR|nr:abscisic acid 8'-hydroxylase 2 [Medicago truncatula]KEH40924.1 cytochrome P450 family ABA 8'-hydroxylase [Medicago truncatula]RHN78335.1 putative (+)-abscisic acid 8'-hydroxylase [Medicago truncatula]